MPFDQLSTKLQDVFKQLKGKGKLTDKDVKVLFNYELGPIENHKVTFNVDKCMIKEHILNCFQLLDIAAIKALICGI